MKVADKNKNKKDKVKKKGGVNKPKPKKEQVLVVAQEIKYARWLSGNDKKTRDRVLKALKKWISNCFEKGYEFKEDDFTRVWKGLFYAVWMSDKPLVQEELCENISGIVDLFPAEHLNAGLLMVKAGLKMLATEWYGIDHHRMDKFLMLVRRYLRGSLRLVARCEWSVPSCEKYAKMLSGSDGVLAVKTPHYARNATSMLLHIIDCFLEELAKVSEGNIPPASVCALLHPFAALTCSADNSALAIAARRLLTALLRQSEEGLLYQEKTNAWKQMGCPAGGPDALEPMSDDEDAGDTGDTEDTGDTPGDHGDSKSKPLDPRAGRVDVVLAPLPVPASMLASVLRSMLTRAPPAAHKRLRICLERFEALSRGSYPLPVSEPEVVPATPLPRARRAARSLLHLDQKLRVDADELKLRGLSRKHRKRLLRKSRAGLSIVDDAALTRDSNNGEWLVEPAETKPKKADKEASKDEDEDKSKKNSKSPKKRKIDPAPRNGEASKKKRKIDKSNKNDLANKEGKKGNLVIKENKKNNVVNKEHKKNNVADDKSASKDKNNKEKVAKTQKSETKVVTKEIQQKGFKGKDDKAKNIKTKDGKDNKSKNQPEIISNKIGKGKSEDKKIVTKPTFLSNKVKKFQKQLPSKEKKEIVKNGFETPKKVKFELKKNSMQKPVDYYKSVRQSPNIPFDSSKKPTKTNLKPSTPSPINPFLKKKLRMKH